MTYKLFAVLMLFFAGLGAVQAQTPEPTATPADVVLQLYTDLRFPGEIFWEATIPLPATEVARVELVIQAQGLPPIQVNFPPEPYTFANEYVIVRYTWAITPQIQPPLFSTITYTWRVITQRDRIIETSNTLLYTDERLDWQETALSEIPITLMYPSQLSLNINSLTTQLTHVYNRLQADTGSTSLAFRFLLFPQTVPLGCDEDAEGNPIVIGLSANLLPETLPCDVALAERAYQNSGYENISVAQNTNIGSLLTAQLITAFYTPFWAGRDIPAWFRSGLEQFYLGNGGSGALGVARAAFRQNNRVLSLDEMAAEPQEANEKIIWQAQSYGMVLYIARQIGVEPTFDLAQVEDFAAAYSAAANTTLGALIPDWQVWMLSDEAVRTYGYSIYLSTTPTPTFTPTATLTRTPRPPTETLTFTPDYSPTPRPTRTPIPPTPTITPLPAQSFSLRPTAVPTPIPAAIANSPIPGLTLPQVVVGGVMLVVVIILLVLLLRPRR